MYVNEYLSERVQLGEITPSSKAVIRSVLRSWLRVADPDPANWTREQVAQWCDQGTAPNTQKSRLTKLRPYIEWLQYYGHISHDPTARIRRGPAKERPPRNLSRGEVEAVYAACDRRTRMIVTLMLQAGFRRSEVSSLRMSDVHMRRMLIDVRGKGGRGEVTRTLPISNRLGGELEAMFYDRAPRTRGFVVESHDMQPLSPAWVGTLVTRVLYDAGIKQYSGDGQTPHCLRHTFAQDSLDRGATLEQLKYLMGHANYSSTEHYMRHNPSGLDLIVNRLDDDVSPRRGATSLPDFPSAA